MMTRLHFGKNLRSLPWLVRAALFWLIISSLAPVQQRVFPESYAVQTHQPALCVHTDLINEVDEWKIQQTFRLIREMGATRIVEFFPWAYIQPRKNQLNWFQADRLVQHAEEQGIQIIARMGLVPEWARPPNTTFNHIEDDTFEAFADFIASFAQRYAGKISHIIIWNEPNLAFEWGYQDFSPERYTAMLEAIYPQVKAANPDIVILAGALAPTLEPDGSPNGLNDLTYLRRMYEAEAGSSFDALAVHSYGQVTSAFDQPATDQINFRRTELLHDIMHEFGDRDKLIYITESGWNDHPRWIQAVSPAQRVANTLDALAWSANNWPWVENTCIWLFRYTRPTGTYRDNFTIVTPDFQIKPIYYAVQSFARGWEQETDLWLPAPAES